MNSQPSNVQHRHDDPADAARSILQSDEYELPVLPEVSVQLLKLTADVNCDPKDIVDLFRRDQSLTAHLLKIANSVRYSCGQTVISIQQAVARLGLLQVREVVVLISCQSKVFCVEAFEDDVKMSFQRSLATAAFAQEIARVRRLNVEDAFLGGLLHDIGRPVLLQSLTDYRRAAEADFSDDALLQAADENTVEMGCRLVEAWELPERLGHIIRHQESPLEAGEHQQQTALLNLAKDLAIQTLDSEAEFPEQLTHPMLDVLNVYPEDMQPVLNQRSTILEWVRSTI